MKNKIVNILSNFSLFRVKEEKNTVQKRNMDMIAKGIMKDFEKSFENLAEYDRRENKDSAVFR